MAVLDSGLVSLSGVGSRLGEQSLMRLYVGNLPFKASEQDVHEFFAQSGVQVDSVSVMRDRMTGEPRGFGFAEVEDSRGEEVIRLCHGRELLGRALVINEARPMTPGGGGGGGGGRERRGGGGFGGDRGGDRGGRGRY